MDKASKTPGIKLEPLSSVRGRVILSRKLDEILCRIDCTESGYYYEWEIVQTGFPNL